jgi:hypothetical protein
MPAKEDTMKRFLVALAFSVGVAAPVLPAWADEARPAAEVEVLAATPTEEFTELVDGEVKIHDVVSNVTEVYEAVKSYRTEKETQAKLALLLLLLAIAFKAVISGAKLVANEFLSSPGGKTAIRVSTLFLGLAVLMLSRVGAGMHWIDAFFLSLSGPGAIVVHELLDLFRGDKDAA